MKNLQTIKLNKEYKRAYYKGKFKPHPLVVTYMVKNRKGFNRVGITTSKKVGKAFERNRARRIIRAAYLNIRDAVPFDCGYDIVFVARAQTPAAKATEIEKVLLKQFPVLIQQIKQKQSV